LVNRGVEVKGMDGKSPAELESLKARMKATWMAGDFGVIGRSHERAAEEFIARRSLAPEARVLDVACGTGNLAIVAARGGARVIGVDIATNLLRQARARAESEQLVIQFDEGDAEHLPYSDEAFDVVVSMFGVMFAPHPDVAAAELVRVCRPGGTIALANWTPTGFTGQTFKAVARHFPPPANLPAPTQWGDESIVRQRLRDGIFDLRMTPRTATFSFPYPPALVVEAFRTYFGPISNAFAALDPSGQAALRRELEQLWSAHNRATDGTTAVDSEYLEIIATRA
jgi:2-polyprenyl-3-methyl-5-hydroxy-6-metoxy-1,4-benzoquinol methylase